MVLCAQDPEIGVFKPHPRGIEATLVRLGVVASEAVYIGDRSLDVDSSCRQRLSSCVIVLESLARPHPLARDHPLQRTTRQVGVHMSVTASVSEVEPPVALLPPKGHATLRGHLKIMRVDHWVKQVFVMPGIILALAGSTLVVSWRIPGSSFQSAPVRMLFVASSNYVINEVLDAPSDLSHPVKRNRPVPSGQVNIRLAYVQWIAPMVVGVGLGLRSTSGITMLVLWLMGCAVQHEAVPHQGPSPTWTCYRSR